MSNCLEAKHSNTYIGQPICSDGHAYSLRSVRRGKQLRGHDPVDTADAVGKAGNIQPYEDSSRPAGTFVVVPRVLVDCIKGADNQLAYTHADSSGQENSLSPPSIKEHDGWNCRDKVDDSDDPSSKEIDRIPRQPDALEYSWGVVL